MDNETIIEVLKDMLENMCIGCGGCRDKCPDYEVIEYLLIEKGGLEK